MAHELMPLCNWFSSGHWPVIRCPTCSGGILSTDGELQLSESWASREAYRRQGANWDPLMVQGVFSGTLHCQNASCQELVAVAGRWITDVLEDPDPTDGMSYGEHLRIEYLNPAPPLIQVPEQCPDTVRAMVLSASTVLWLRPAAAANFLRSAVEYLLDAKRVRKTGENRRRLSLHGRIVEFRASRPEEADVLEAVKWIGNEGSHGDGLTTEEVLEGADLLSWAIESLYDEEARAMRRRVRDINRRQRP